LAIICIIGVLLAIFHRLGNASMHSGPGPQTEIGSLRSALDRFELDTGSYPKGLVDLVQRPSSTTKWRGPYLERIPKDSWGNVYIYESPGKHNADSYDLISAGPDGRVGTEDDICNWTTK
jgi:general secretion pathway protein G